jgi:DNA invertase Pin-like site-specific DNA recombinase
MKRTALYLRASSRDQIQHGFSIPDQLTRLRSEARVASERVVAEFIDQARSGTSAAKRTDYQNLLAAARRHEFDRIRVESVDRGHRNDLERRQFEAEMAALGIDVVYSGEPEKQAPQYRKLQRGIKGVLAEWESDETSQRTYKRHHYRAQKGMWRGGHPPYGLQPDGKGWFESEPESYPILLWILERRAESKGHHAIAKLLNAGIDLGNGPVVPPTPSVLAYRRKPYLERQDPETGDIVHLPRRLPATTWHKKTIEHLCRQAVNGVYAGILNWGYRHNRFVEDADGNQKSPVSVDTGRSVVPLDLLERVRVVELMPTDGPQRMSDFNSFLLSLRCGLCGEAMHGYTSTKISRSGKAYKYRKYRCAGRANNPGACRMHILSAEALEQVVIKAVFADVAQRDGERLQDEINESIERHREVLLEALRLLEEQLPGVAQQREAALIAVIDPTLPPAVKKAIIERADRLVAEYEEIEARQQMIRASLDSLTTKARSIIAVLTDPNLDPTRWREPAVFAALRRALTLLVKNAFVREGNSKRTYLVELTVTTDPIAEPDSAAFVNLGNSRARGSRTHRRGSSPRPLVLKTRTATGPHPLSRRILLAYQTPVNDKGRRPKRCVRPSVFVQYRGKAEGRNAVFGLRSLFNIVERKIRFGRSRLLIRAPLR